jgi:hypothetical protein
VLPLNSDVAAGHLLLYQTVSFGASALACMVAAIAPFRLRYALVRCARWVEGRAVTPLRYVEPQIATTPR